MKCPQCHNNSSRVVDSRPADDGHAIRRAVNANSVVIGLQPLNELK